MFACQVTKNSCGKDLVWNGLTAEKFYEHLFDKQNAEVGLLFSDDFRSK